MENIKKNNLKPSKKVIILISLFVFLLLIVLFWIKFRVLFEVKEEKSNENYVYVVSYKEMYTGSTIPDGVKIRKKPSIAIADWASINFPSLSPKPFYIKHKMNNERIEESYVEFVVTKKMAKNNKGMVAGTYTLEGVDSGKPFLEKVNKIKQIFDYTNHSDRCYGNLDSYFTCHVPGLSVDVLSDGSVSVGDDVLIMCTVSDSSYCWDEGKRKD